MFAQTKLITFILPSRSRKELLIDCVNTLISQIPSEHRSLVEIIVRLDNDDPALPEIVADLPFSEIDIQLLAGYRGNGYSDGYIFNEECARLSRAAYFALWNDDARFATKDWFSIFYNIAKSQAAIYSYWFSGIKVRTVKADGTEEETEWPSFIFHHRKFWEILGFVSGKGGADSFIYYVLGPLGLLKKIPEIMIDHKPWFMKPKEEWDETTKAISQPGQMLPTDFELVKQCQQKIIAFVQKQNPQGN